METGRLLELTSQSTRLILGLQSQWEDEVPEDDAWGCPMASTYEYMNAQTHTRHT